MSWTATLTELLKFFNTLLKLRVSPEKQIQKVVSIYDTMNMVLRETSVERFLIFKAHNGGGIIKPTGELYVSTLYEEFTEPFYAVKWKYQKLEVDKEYVKMLLNLIQDKVLQCKTSDLKDSMLKGLYENDGVVESKIYYLGQDKKAVYFCSCSTSTEWNPTQAENSTLDVAISTIKQNIK
jgi:hypothetical protein